MRRALLGASAQGNRHPRRSRVAIVVSLAIGLLAAPLTLPVQGQGLSDQIANARQRQAAINRSIDRQRKLLAELAKDENVARTALSATGRSLDGINADQAAVREEIAEATDALARVQARRENLLDELRHLDWTLALLEQEIADGDKELDGRRRLLGARLAEAYRSQNTTLLEQVLADRSFTDVLSAANAYLAYGEEDAQLAESIAADQRALDQLRALTTSTSYRTDQLRRDAQSSEVELKAQQDRLARAKDKLRRLETDTRRVQSAQRSAFQRITGNQKKARQLVARQAAAERQLERKIASLVAEAKRRAAAQAAQSSGGGGGGLSEGNGAFSWPTTGIVSQEFGCTGFPWEPPRGSCAHFHDGIDIANGEGTLIRAPQSGVIAFVGWNPYDSSDPSYMVVMGHPGGYQSMFSHLQPRAVVRRGQSVRKGQIIGYMGNTGNSTGPHLHWEVKRGGALINPRSIV
jgi:murein DD-endopeptidase MepM/ murein hydrolase activator NlpD